MGNETSKLEDAVHHKKKHRKSQQFDNFSHEVETFFKVIWYNFPSKKIKFKQNSSR